VKSFGEFVMPYLLLSCPCSKLIIIVGFSVHTKIGFFQSKFICLAKSGGAIVLKMFSKYVHLNFGRVLTIFK